MKKKIISGIIWIAITIFYVWLLGDTGRSIGANTKDAYENYVEYYANEYIGIEGFAEGITDAWSYNQFNDLEEEFKSSMIGIGVQTCAYVSVTIVLYHIAIYNNRNNDEKESKE